MEQKAINKPLKLALRHQFISHSIRHTDLILGIYILIHIYHNIPNTVYGKINFDAVVLH